MEWKVRLLSSFIENLSTFIEKADAVNYVAIYCIYIYICIHIWLVPTFLQRAAIH